jgi:hypothetical protein
MCNKGFLREWVCCGSVLLDPKSPTAQALGGLALWACIPDDLSPARGWFREGRV